MTCYFHFGWIITAEARGGVHLVGPAETQVTVTEHENVIFLEKRGQGMARKRVKEDMVRITEILRQMRAVIHRQP